MKRPLVLLAIALALAGCTSDNKNAAPVVVGGESTTAGRIYVEALAHAIEGEGHPAVRKPDLGGSIEVDAAARAGRIDVYVEYTDDALASVVRPPNGGQLIAQGASVVLQKLRAVYEPAGLVWAEPLGEDNPLALVVRGNTAPVSISDAVAPARNWRAAFSFEFQQRPDGYPAVQKGYGFQLAEVKTMDAARLYQALASHEVDVVSGNANDGSFTRLGLRALADDKRVFGSNQAVPVYRKAALAKFPGLAGLLKRIAGGAKTERMRALVEQVDSGKRTAAQAGAELAGAMTSF